jgi:hypothetical protein
VGGALAPRQDEALEAHEILGAAHLAVGKSQICKGFFVGRVAALEGEHPDDTPHGSPAALGQAVGLGELADLDAAHRLPRPVLISASFLASCQ